MEKMALIPQYLPEGFPQSFEMSLNNSDYKIEPIDCKLSGKYLYKYYCKEINELL